MSTSRGTAFSTPPAICEQKSKNFASFRTLSVVRHADSLENIREPRSKLHPGLRELQSRGTGQQSKNPRCILTYYSLLKQCGEILRSRHMRNIATPQM
jgi:hypothetical protein